MVLKAWLAVVVPMFNEGGHVRESVAAILAAVEQVDGARLVIVDDGSTDNTRAELEVMVAGERFDLVCCDSNRGYGAALAAGARWADARGMEWVLFMDSDLTNPPSDIARFAVICRAGGFDLVKASRFVEGGGMTGVPLARRLFSVGGNLVFRAALRSGVRDVTNGFRAIRIQTLREMPLHEDGFLVIVEEMYYAQILGLQVAEIPTDLASRSVAQGSSLFSYDVRTLFRYLNWARRIALARHSGGTPASRGKSS